jgi:3-oxoadipate enol-lactonase
MGRLETIKVGPAPRIAVSVAGEGPLVVFLHGIGGNRTNFDDQIQWFSQHWRAVAWDARGYGESDDPDGPLDFGDFSEDLVRVLDHFEARQACLVGVSMGGRIALDFYGRRPDRVAALVLADTSGGTQAAQDPAKIEAFLAARRTPLIVDGKTPTDIAPGIAKSFAGPHITPLQFDRLVGSLSALRTIPYLKTLEAVTRYHAFPPFASIAVPTLVMTGEHDPIAPPSMAIAMAADIPKAEFLQVPRAGHISNIENAAAFNAYLEGFLMRAWPGRECAS